VLAAVLLVALLSCGLGGHRVVDWARAQAGSVPSGPTAAATDPAAQAAAVQSVLNSARDDRHLLLTAIADVDNCRNLTSAPDTFRQVATDRRNEHDAAAQLRTDLLPAGAQLKQTLADALAHSQAADNHFAGWADGVRTAGCTAASLRADPLPQAQQESQLATAGKNQFIQLWSPVARSYGLPVPAETDI
jgi:hypothetical protein